VSLEVNHKPIKEAKEGDEVAVRIEGIPELTFGRHMDVDNLMFSMITRDSIDALKQTHRELIDEKLIELIKQLKNKYK